MSHASAHFPVRHSHLPAAISTAVTGMISRITERAAARPDPDAVLPRWEMPVYWPRLASCAACGEPVEPGWARCAYCATRTC